ncbi:hypothetical protein F5148DRAFT_1150797, partial [Russula earlei]
SAQSHYATRGKRKVYPITMHLAKTAVANALIDGWKSVELCQAYIPLSIYAVPARRIATGLNLHILPPKKPTTEQQELEMLNRTQIWIICFNIDKSIAMQFGKPSTLKKDFTLMIGISHLTLEHDRLLTNCRQEWAEPFERTTPTPPASSASNFFHYSPAHLCFVALQLHQLREARHVLFWVPKAWRAPRPSSRFSSIPWSQQVTYVLHQMVPETLGHFALSKTNVEIVYFIFAAFASAFILKLLCPECSRFITQGLETEVCQVIKRLIATIGSPQIAIDECHTLKLYSRFLESLLAKHKRDGTAQGCMLQQGPPPRQMQTGSKHNPIVTIAQC